MGVILQQIRRQELHRVVRPFLHQRLHPLQQDGHDARLEVLADRHRVHVDLGRGGHGGGLGSLRSLRVVVAGILGGGEGLILFGLYRNCVVNGKKGRGRGQGWGTEMAPKRAPAGEGTCARVAVRSWGDRVTTNRPAIVRTFRFGHGFRPRLGSLPAVRYVVAGLAGVQTFQRMSSAKTFQLSYPQR